MDSQSMDMTDSHVVAGQILSGRCSISKAVGLFHGHVWLMLLFCFVSPSLRPHWLHTQLTHKHRDRQGSLSLLFHQLSDLLFTVQLISSPSSTHSLTLGSWFPSSLPRIWCGDENSCRADLSPDSSLTKISLDHNWDVMIPWKPHYWILPSTMTIDSKIN